MLISDSNLQIFQRNEGPATLALVLLTQRIPPRFGIATQIANMKNI